MTRLSSLVSSTLAALLIACSPQVADSSPAGSSEPAPAQIHPISGLAVIPVTITSADGTTLVIQAEFALEDADKGRGLMFRTEMGADEGMLFDYESRPGQLSFWMRNTVLPLDLIFIDTERRVLNIAADAVPYSEDRILAEGVAGAVLELNAGRAAQLGIAPGDKVAW